MNGKWQYTIQYYCFWKTDPNSNTFRLSIRRLSILRHPFLCRFKRKSFKNFNFQATSHNSFKKSLFYFASFPTRACGLDPLCLDQWSSIIQQSHDFMTHARLEIESWKVMFVFQSFPDQKPQEKPFSVSAFNRSLHSSVLLLENIYIYTVRVPVQLVNLKNAIFKLFII